MAFKFFLIPRVKLKIRWKLLAVLLLLITFALALTNSLWTYSIRPLLKEKIIESQEEIAKHAAFRIEEFVQAKVRNLILHSQTEAFLTKNVPAAEVELAIILRQDGDLREVSFIDQAGKELATLTPEKIFTKDELREQSESSKFIIPTFRYGAEYRSRVHFSAEGEPLITLSVPLVVPATRHNIEEISTIEPIALRRGTGEILGVLAAEASLKDILVRTSESFDEQILSENTLRRTSKFSKKQEAIPLSRFLQARVRVKAARKSSLPCMKFLGFAGGSWCSRRHQRCLPLSVAWNALPWFSFSEGLR